MTQEETNKRNEAIAIANQETTKRDEAIRIMMGKEKIHNNTYVPYHNMWHLLMPAYVFIESLGYHFSIESRKRGHNVYIMDKYFNDIGVGACRKDLKTAIWLTVSDFAMEFNKLKL